METLTTPRMYIRDITETDTDILLKILGDPVVMQFFPGIFDRAGVEQWIQVIRAEYPFNVGLQLAVHRTTHAPLGIVGVGYIDVDSQPELELHAAFLKSTWGQRFAVEGAKAAVARGFRVSTVSRIIGIIHPDNSACHKAAERVGLSFSHETIHEGERTFIYAIDRGEIQTAEDTSRAA